MLEQGKIPHKNKKKKNEAGSLPFTAKHHGRRNFQVPQKPPGGEVLLEINVSTKFTKVAIWDALHTLDVAERKKRQAAPDRCLTINT